MIRITTIINEKYYSLLTSEFEFDNEDYIGRKGEVGLNRYFYSDDEVRYHQKEMQDFAIYEGFDIEFIETEIRPECLYEEYGVDEGMFH